GDWSDTLVLTEHKAFLFDKARDLLAIPVFVYRLKDVYLWRGVYVFNVTLSGLNLRGTITHQEEPSIYWDSSFWIKRALYIDDVLYTVSEAKLKMNSLEDLSFLGEIRLNDA
ncbi:MAG: beta-propeller domain-containing protein, partial [Candidatus Bathycorpusculaceae bacterium]